MNLIVLSIATFASFTSASVPSLTPENFVSLTSGKVVFIKYFAPWCGHCQAMASDWEKIAEEWAGSNDGFIGEVDCTIEDNSALCQDVQGFPTLKYGEPDNLNDYEGGREYKELSDFAKENLTPTCSVSNIALCDEGNKTVIEEFKAMSIVDIEAKIQEIDDNINKMENDVEEEINRLEEHYQAIIKEGKDEVWLTKVKGNYKFLKGVLKSKEDTEVGSAATGDEL